MKKKPETKADRVTRHVMYALAIILYGIFMFAISPIVFCLYIPVVVLLILLKRHRNCQRGRALITSSPASSEHKPKSEEQIKQEEEQRRNREEARRRDRERRQQLYEAWKEEYPLQAQKLIEWKDGLPFIPDVLYEHFEGCDIRNIMHYRNWIAQTEGHSLLDTVRDCISFGSICDTIRATKGDYFDLIAEIEEEYPKVRARIVMATGGSACILAMDTGVASPGEREEILSLLKKHEINVLTIRDAYCPDAPITLLSEMTDWVTGEVYGFHLEDAGWDNDTSYSELVLHTISKPPEDREY